MNYISKSLFRFLLLITIISTAMQAKDEIKFYLENEPVYTTDSTKSPGFLLEVVTKMTHILNINPEVNFLLWKDAQDKTIKTKNAMIFPLARTIEREPNYRWIAKIMDVPVMFVTKSGQPIINSFDEAKKLNKIGVISGTPAEDILLNAGLTNLQFVSATELYKSLSENKFDAIFTAQSEAAIAWRDGKYKEKLQFGEELMNYHLWIASNKNSPAINISDWNNALIQVIKSGVYQEIYQKYYK